MQVENTCGVILLYLKKYFAGIIAALMIFVNSSQVLADEIEIFGGEFGDETQPVEEVPVVETQPVEEVPVVETPPVEEVPVVETPPTETFNPTSSSTNNEEEDFGDSLNFNDVKEQNSQPTVIQPNYPESNSGVSNNTTVKTPKVNNTPSQTASTSASAPKQKLKNLPQRFVQVAVDEDYIYYLDKQSVSWKKIPYMNSEYMADVWVRMIERNPNTDDLPEDLANYVNDVNTDEISLARAKGYQYMPEDIKVLRNKKYFLEHYYLRPKTEQIQFLCELEVVGHPQNTATQRKYDYQNWEELIPGSMESILYYSIIQVIGKSKASERGHMTFFDMVEEYARISVR